MSKGSRVINGAAQGLVTSQYHAYWSDVNPIKRQTLTREDHYERRKREDEAIERQRKRQELIRKVYPNSKILKG